MYGEGLIAVRAKLKGGKMRYVPMPSELAGEIRKCVAANDTLVVAINAGDRLFPPKSGATTGRQRVEGSFEDLLKEPGSRISVLTISVTHSRPGS
jgi:hypothetical protein